MGPADAVAGVLVVAGAVFFIAGTVGLVRFPDVYTRLHALSKADNLGLGLIVLGLAVSADRVLDVVHLALVWLLVLLASATSAHLIARRALHRGEKPWTRADR